MTSWGLTSVASYIDTTWSVYRSKGGSIFVLPWLANLYCSRNSRRRASNSEYWVNCSAIGASGIAEVNRFTA